MEKAGRGGEISNDTSWNCVKAVLLRKTCKILSTHIACMQMDQYAQSKEQVSTHNLRTGKYIYIHTQSEEKEDENTWNVGELNVIQVSLDSNAICYDRIQSTQTNTSTAAHMGSGR